MSSSSQQFTPRQNTNTQQQSASNSYSSESIMGAIPPPTPPNTPASATNITTESQIKAKSKKVPYATSPQLTALHNYTCFSGILRQRCTIMDWCHAKMLSNCWKMMVTSWCGERMCKERSNLYWHWNGANAVSTSSFTWKLEAVVTNGIFEALRHSKQSLIWSSITRKLTNR